MAKYLLGRQISGRKIITNDGEDFGRVIDLAVNEVTGEIEYLVVDPNPDNPFEEKLERDEEGHLQIPYRSVVAVGDYVIIEKKVLL